jgi:hypothetical protein
MSAIRTYLGDPIDLPSGESLSVYIEHWGNEAPDTLAIDGHACLVFFDPGTKTGRAAITDLISRLQAALVRHDADVASIYANLKPGDDPARVRVADKTEACCSATFGGEQCERVEHVDPFHLTIEDTARVYAVRSVWRANR